MGAAPELGNRSTEGLEVGQAGQGHAVSVSTHDCALELADPDVSVQQLACGGAVGHNHVHQDADTVAHDLQAATANTRQQEQQQGISTDVDCTVPLLWSCWQEHVPDALLCPTHTSTVTAVPANSQ